MKVIEKFVEKVLSSDENFVITKELKSDYNYFYVQVKVGNAKYIYGKDGRNVASSINKQFELAAIVSDKTVYVTNHRLTDTWSTDNRDLPENAKFLYDKQTELNNYIKTEIFPEFYKNLPVEEIKDSYKIKEFKRSAREKILKNNLDFDVSLNNNVFNEQDTADYLCGFIDLKEAERRLEKSKKNFITKKSINNKIKEFMEDETTVEKWEINLAESINETDAKYVTAEFEFKGKISSAKIEPKKIIYSLINKNYFSYWDFESNPKGEKLFQELGLKRNEDAITCGNITKITYKRKNIYVRDTEINGNINN